MKKSDYLYAKALSKQIDGLEKAVTRVEHQPIYVGTEGDSALRSISDEDLDAITVIVKADLQSRLDVALAEFDAL